MPKSRRRKPKKLSPQQSGRQAPAPQPPPAHRSTLRTATEVVLGVVTILGFLLVFLPRPIASVEDPRVASNVLTSPFFVENNSIIPLEHVQVAMGLCEVDIIRGDGAHIRLKAAQAGCKVTMTLDKWQNHTLQSDDKWEIVLLDLISNGVPQGIAGATYGDIYIDIKYSPWFLPIQREKEFRFQTRIDNGQIRWAPIPIN